MDEKEEGTEHPSKITHVLITVHGIRDNGDWQDHLSDLYRKNDSSASARAYKYGFFDLLKFTFPPMRALQTAAFARKLNRQVKKLRTKYPALQRIDLAAHSFGTHVIFNSLRKLEEPAAALVGNVAFMSSVLPARVDWDEATKGSPNASVVNFCSVNDWVLLVNAALPLNSGIAGRVGFKEVFDGDNFQQRFFRLSHGGYFDKDTDWLENWCLPALRGELVPKGTHDRPKYGDFFSSFMGFTKGATTVFVFALALAAYTLLTSDGVLRAAREKAAEIAQRPALDALMSPEIEDLVPKFPYSLLPQFREFDAKDVQALFARLSFENDVVAAWEGMSERTAVAVDPDGMRLAAGNSSGLRIFSPRMGDAALSFSVETEISDPVVGIHVNSGGEIVAAADDGTLFASCVECPSGWEAFAAGDGLANWNVVTRSGAGLLAFSTSWDYVSPTIIRQSGPVQVLTNDGHSWDVPMLRYGLDGSQVNDLNVTFIAGDLPAPFDEYSWVGDRNTFVVFRRANGESLIVSRDPGDVGMGGASIDGNLAIEARYEQIEAGRSRFGDGHADAWHCRADKAECTAWMIPFSPAHPDQLRLNPFVEGDRLRMIVGSGGNYSCLDLGSAGEEALALRPEGALSVACPAEEMLLESVGRNKALNVGDHFLVSRGNDVGLKENSSFFRRLPKVHTDRVAVVDLRDCADFFDGTQLLDGIAVYSYENLLFVQCGGSIQQFDHWGKRSEAIVELSGRGSPPYSVLPLMIDGAFVGSVRIDHAELSVFDLRGTPLLTPLPIATQERPASVMIGPDATYVVFVEEGTLGWVRLSEEPEGSVGHAGKVFPQGVAMDEMEKVGLCSDGLVVLHGWNWTGNSTREEVKVVLDSTTGRPTGSTTCVELPPVAGDNLAWLDIGTDRSSALILGDYDLRLDRHSGGPPSWIFVRLDLPEEDVRARARSFMEQVWQ